MIYSSDLKKIYIVSADTLEVEKSMIIKDFHLMGLSNEGVTYLTRDNSDGFVIQMLIVEKNDRNQIDAIQYDLPSDFFNVDLLCKAQFLFSFIDGIVGIGWNKDKSKEINKIQFYQLPKLVNKKEIANSSQKAEIL